MMKKLFKMSVNCRFVYEGEEAPDFCPKCGAPKNKFEELTEEQANKIYTSDRTNDIHMELVNLSMRIIELCEEGIKLTRILHVLLCLDAIKETWVIKQRSKSRAKVI